MMSKASITKNRRSIYREQVCGIEVPSAEGGQRPAPGLCLQQPAVRGDDEGWGLDPEKDLDKIVSIGAGGYIQKKDRSLMHETFDRHRRERKEAIAADQTGEGFIFDMFLYELNNHEYGYTGDTSEALEALGLTAQEVVDDPRMNRGICKAHQVIMGRDE